jgi:hypothetical protein
MTTKRPIVKTQKRAENVTSIFCLGSNNCSKLSGITEFESMHASGNVPPIFKRQSLLLDSDVDPDHLADPDPYAF